VAGEIEAALDRAVFDHQDRVRNQALADGWDPEIARSLTLRREGTQIGVTWPREMDDAVMAMEYGDQNRAPTGTVAKSMRGIKVDKQPVVDFVKRALR
jgi:hypothetical protein